MPGGGLLGREVLVGEHGAGREGPGADEALAEQVPHVGELGGDGVLVDGRAPHPLEEAHALDEGAQLGGLEGHGGVGAEHAPRERQVDLEHDGAEGDGGQARVDRAGVVGQPDGAAEPRLQLADHVEPEPLGRGGVHRRALQQDGLDARRRGTPCTIALDLGVGGHPGGDQDRQPVLRRGGGAARTTGSRRRRSSRPTRPTRRSRSTASTEKAELMKPRPLLLAVLAQPRPLRLGELHALPVLVAGGVLVAELDPPRLVGRALGGRDVGLELDGVHARLGGRGR